MNACKIEYSRSATVDCIEWVRNYARTRLNTLLADERGCLPPNVFLDFGRRGLLGLTASRELGGCELLPGDALRVLRQISIVDLSLGNAIAMHNFLGGFVILEHASPELRREYARDFAMGRQIAAFALTEECAGSDPRRIEMSATQQADGTWVLNGRKIWSGLAAWASVAAVFAVAKSFDGTELGITGYVVPLDLLGVRHGSEAMTMGLRSVVQSELVFDSVGVSPEHVLGPVGQGLMVAQSAMMPSRFAMAVFANAAMLRSISILRRYVGQRRIGSGPMSENPHIADVFAQETARTHALNLFLEANFQRLNEGATPSDLMYLVAKIVGPEQGWNTVDRVIQLLGGRGYMEPNAVARIARDARVLRIFEGPTEAMTSYLGSFASLKSHSIEETFAKLDATDLFELIRQRLTEGNPRNLGNQHRHRTEIQRLQYGLGTLTAFALYFACVRQFASDDDSDQIAVRLCEETFFQLLDTPIQFEAWCPRETSDRLGKRLEAQVGAIEESKGGPSRDVDPMLHGFPEVTNV
ncbi:MAG: acyl-CoA/acyl-ACP dehydrogenase [Fimbriimonas sp.]|nr:acyl-CoA/acyl-ACP dehydrogenase [Fimbriimonas sp.]